MQVTTIPALYNQLSLKLDKCLKIRHSLNMKLRLISIALFLILPIVGYTKPTCNKLIKVGVVDTGLNLDDPRLSSHICKTGHKNFVENETIDDLNGHGTFIAGLIQQYAGKANYCLMIYKFYQQSAPGELSVKRETLAMEEAVNNGANIVNFSGGGTEFSEREAILIKTHPEVTFVVAAGNDGHDLDIPGNEYYPASLFYPNMEVVENIGKNGFISLTSNFSKRIKDKEIGENILSYLPDGRMGRMSGTSMSTATFSGKLVDKLSKSCEYRK